MGMSHKLNTCLHGRCITTAQDWPGRINGYCTTSGGCACTKAPPPKREIISSRMFGSRGHRLEVLCEAMVS